MNNLKLPAPYKTTKQILETIRQGEGEKIEFKSCHEKISKNVFETVCAFLNRHGGEIFLGVKDSGEIYGIAQEKITSIKQDFANTMNNSQKINPPFRLAVNEIHIQNKIILHILVPESSRVHRCGKSIYDRYEDGDMNITEDQTQISAMYKRKQTVFSEIKIYPHASINDLRTDLIQKCRSIVSANNPNHPWANTNDEEFLRSAKLYNKNFETDEKGITLAGILLLGKDETIQSVLPAYRTDLILCQDNGERYDDREIITTNLIDTYDKIMEFVKKHLPDKFYLENTNRISLRDIIFREIASNIIIHREYTDATPSRLIIEPKQAHSENPNNPKNNGELNPNKIIPQAKNPIIGSFFREIGRADELGSGLRNLMKYGKIYGNKKSQMIENDIFKIIIHLPHRMHKSNLAQQQKTSQNPALIKIVKIMSGDMTRQEIMKKLQQENRPYFHKHYQKPAIDNGLIEMTIPNKPKSRKQKYRLTEEGEKFIKLVKENYDE